MNHLIGTKFFQGKTEYVVYRVQPFDKELVRLIEIAEETGKYPAMFFARKVLKSGKKSKQGGVFYHFHKTGNFIKAL